METKKEKMVYVEGMWVAISKAEGRRKAKSQGRAVIALLAEDQSKEDQALRDANYSEEDINCMRSATRIARLEAMGFGTSSRIRLGSPQR